VKIVNIVNPNFSGDFEGFKIEIMDGDSSVILEKIEFPGTVTVLPGLLTSTYKAEAAFKWGYIDYGFEINVVNKVD